MSGRNQVIIRVLGNWIGVIGLLTYFFLECWPVHFYPRNQPDHPLNGMNEVLIIGDTFTSREKEQIVSAGREWEAATEGGIRFQFKGRNIPIGVGSSSLPAAEQSQTVEIESISEHSLMVVYLDLASGGGTVLGFYDPDNRKISIIKERVSDKMFKGVVLHELFHSWGGMHSDSPLDLMYPYISEWNSEIGDGDIEAACKIVKCASHQ